MSQKCNVCQMELEEVGGENLGHHMHLLVTKSLIDGHIHTHGDLPNKEAMQELIEHAQVEIGLDKGSKKSLSRKEIVFKNRQRIGDMLMFTCGVRDFKRAYPEIRVNVVSIAGHIWDHNPHIDRTLLATPENTIEIGPGKLTNKSNSLDWHFANAFRISIEEKLDIAIQQGESRPDIYFTQEEWEAPRLFDKPYWIISTTGEKGWGCKMYPTHKWQEVIDQNPDITFLQIGTAEDNAPRLKGANVIDYVGKTQSRDNGIRDLFKLFLNAEGSIGLVSFHMHLSGSLYKPCVVIAGGREPVSFTRYAGQAYLSNDGMLPCAIKACWHCSIDACTNLIIREDTIEKKIPKCADIIESEDVTRAIRGYYKGGRLKLGVPSEKPNKHFFKNIVPTPPKSIVSTEPKIETNSTSVNTHGFTFGGGSLTERDWVFISDTIKKYDIKSVLEFGAGLSTLLFKDLGVKTITYESNQGWIDRIKKLNPKCNIILWDGLILSDVPSKVLLSDLAFVDGPAGDKPREYSTKMASEYAKYIIVHDAGREWARKYQDEYLKPSFEGPIKGGHRCHLWIRKETKQAFVPLESNEDQEKLTEEDICKKPIETSGFLTETPKGVKSIKIVSTARGWGGCARSVTTIMKFLVEAGHRVQFIPFRNAVASKEFQQILATDLKKVEVANGYGPIKEACDVMLVYADDYVWEFKTDAVAEIFSEINAEKKIMMLNYRRGEVGKIPWTKGWDQYLFLCSDQEKELLAIYPEAAGKTKVLPPCTILDPFLSVHPNYEKIGSYAIRMVRHNSQGDAKFISSTYPIERCQMEIEDVLSCRPDIRIDMMPGPTFMSPTNVFGKIAKTADTKLLAQFLATGNLYWYSLPYGYKDMGPRVALEAMAVGLPILADDWSGGMADRVTPETGWVLPDKKWVPIIQGLSSVRLEKMGKAAKERAYSEFRPEKWMEVLLS